MTSKDAVVDAPPAREKLSTRWRSQSRKGVILAAAALVFAATAYRVDAPSYLAGSILNVVQWIVVLVATGLMFLRFPVPRIALVATAALQAFAALAELPALGTLIAYAIAVYTVARQLGFRPALISIVPTYLALLAVFVIADDGRFISTPIVGMSGITGLAIGVGMVVRSREESIAMMREIALIAESERASETRRLISEDRLRIARDLHDAVAHQIAVINLNAGLADRELVDRPAEARAALAVVHDAANSVIREITSVMEHLRADNDRPSRRYGLDQVPDLVQEFRNGGLTINFRFTGPGALVDPETSAVAYRVVREGLTNAFKHGSHGKPVELEIALDDREVVIVVMNARGSSREGKGGHGTTDIRELVYALDGSVELIPNGQLFELTARIPNRRS